MSKLKIIIMSVAFASLALIGAQIQVNSNNDKVLTAVAENVEARQQKLAEWKANLTMWNDKAQKDEQIKSAAAASNLSNQGVQQLPNTGNEN